MRIWLVVGIAVGALVVIGAAAYLFLLRGPDLTAYEPLRTPRISTKATMKVISIEFRGKPDEVLMKAFKLLFRTYYSLEGVPKGARQPAPIARFTLLSQLPEDPAEAAEALKSRSGAEWQGEVGLAVPDSVASLPKLGDTAPFSVRMVTWEYGEVAEILHMGSYESELPTIARLRGFIREQGYRISGEHEEEYLRGPGLPFARPESYATIIRYPVTRVP